MVAKGNSVESIVAET